MRHSKIITFLVVALMLISMGAFNSCTDMGEDVYSSLPADEFGSNEQQLVQKAGRAYAHLQGGTSDLYAFWGLQTVSSDESIIPYRVTNLWYDGGVWINLHRHDFSPDNWSNADTWSWLFEGITTANQIIYEIEQSPLQFEAKDKILAELKVLRAWFYLQATDYYGNIPITTDFSDESLPEQSTRADVFQFIEGELTENISALDPYPTAANYGRATQAMANVMLAKLYLNAKEWTGTAMWDEAITATEAIIDDATSPLMLEPNYLDNFKPDNEGSRENIFVVPQHRSYTDGWFNQLNVHQYTLHTLSQQTFGILAFCWDGIAATESHYYLYDSQDQRINSWLEGPQFSASGEPLMLTDTDTLTYRPDVKSLAGMDALLDDGVRFQKYAYESGLREGESMSNDWVIYRYADVLLMKAEALMWKNGGVATGEAVDLVNLVRERAFGSSSENFTVGTLTMDTLLEERSRELAWEGHRRNDLIRFGKWTDAWFEKPTTADYKKLFPIPTTALSVNPNLQQNPGY